MEEIDIKDSIKKVWKTRKVVLFMTLAFIGVGLLVLFLTPEKYESHIILMPNSSGKNGGQQTLNTFASMIGIKFMDIKMGDGIPILAYESIMGSTPFLIELDKRLVALDKSKTVEEPVSKSVKDSLSLRFSEELSYPDLDSSIFLEVDKSKGIFTIRCESDSPILAHRIAEESYQLLEKFIERIIADKIEGQLSTLADNVRINRKRYEDLREHLSDYKDKNRDLSTASSRLSSKILEDEYELKYAIYANGLKQLEGSKNALSLNNIHFSVIQPVTKPVLKSGLSMKLVVPMFACLGFILGVAYALTRDSFLKLYRFLKANS